jgi:hypothetical protein
LKFGFHDALHASQDQENPDFVVNDIALDLDSAIKVVHETLGKKLHDFTKLYALIMQYLSPKSSDEVKHQSGFELSKFNRDVE